MPEEQVHAGRAWQAVAYALAVLASPVLLCAQAAAAPHTGYRITDNLYDTKFVNAEDGWAVGAFGTIVRTRDGGQTWRPQVSHTLEHLYGVGFADVLNGWVVGRSGLALHTSDGGDTWEAQTTGSQRHLFKVAALDPQHAWAVGDWGTILATHDGGKTWEDHTLPHDVILNSIVWADPAHGWIAGEAGAIFATTDGGTTWARQNSGVEKTLFGIDFLDVQRGWAVGIDGLVLHTTDGGATWQVLHGDPSVGALEQVGFAEALDNPSFYDIAVAGKFGYAVGDIGAVLLSEDGGLTWHRKAVPGGWSLHWIRAVSLVSGTHGGFVGAGGLALRIDGDQIKVPDAEEHAPEALH